MNNQVTVEDIERQIAALDSEFDSAANRKSGKLDIDQYQRRHSELRERLKSAERAEKEPTKTAAPSLTREELDSIFWPPKIPGLPSVDSAELNAFARSFDAALRDGDIETARTILKNPRRESLGQSAQLARASETLRSGYATTGARSLLPMLTGVIGVLTHELNETRMSARMDRAARLDPLKAFEEMSARIKALESAIPKYCGTHKVGEHYPRNSIVTHSGALWIALKDTQDKPPSDSWQLCVQKGRDAR